LSDRDTNHNDNEEEKKESTTNNNNTQQQRVRQWRSIFTPNTLNKMERSVRELELVYVLLNAPTLVDRLKITSMSSASPKMTVLGVANCNVGGTMSSIMSNKKKCKKFRQLLVRAFPLSFRRRLIESQNWVAVTATTTTSSSSVLPSLVFSSYGDRLLARLPVEHRTTFALLGKFTSQACATLEMLVTLLQPDPQLTKTGNNNRLTVRTTGVLVTPVVGTDSTTTTTSSQTTVNVGNTINDLRNKSTKAELYKWAKTVYPRIQ
jgi:hypothetical protein